MKFRYFFFIALVWVSGIGLGYAIGYRDGKEDTLNSLGWKKATVWTWDNEGTP